jgi:aromatic-L-amino-acid decarboxylase
VYEAINAAGEFYLTSTVVNDKVAIRVCTGVTKVEEEHVQRMFDILVETAEAEIAKKA